MKENNFINVLLSEKMNPHTFFSYIFLNKIKYEKNEIPKDVIIHEQAHAVQRHSLDILIIEVTQIIFWFNPFLFLLKDAIKLNHEFLADASVLQKGTNLSVYQKTLLSYSSGGLESGLTNPINYSSVKKRFKVMKTKTSKTAVWARSLLVLPLLAMLVYGFSTSEVVVKAQDQKQHMNADETSNIVISEDINVHIFRNGNITVNHQAVKLNELQERLQKINEHLTYEERKDLTSAEIRVEPGVRMGIITDVKTILMKYGTRKIKTYDSENLTTASTKVNSKVEKPEKTKYSEVLLNHQEKATPEMIREFNKIVSGLNEKGMIRQIDLNRIREIQALMTPEQKKNAIQPKFYISPFPKEATESNNYQEKATQKMVEEYNKLAKEYNSKPEGEAIIKKKDYQRMKYIYNLMTSDQKKNSEKFPIPSPPPPPNKEMVAEYNKLARDYNKKEITEEIVQEEGFKRMLSIYKVMTDSQRKNAEKLPPPPPLSTSS
ncbi:hypothetical protein LZ575_12905 [Antarcticibacterium sp. 1MA-6-2]|uniref:M56 family metallopeptidase n=1 Tax=Antarcticibacterium sp. 1MA-6-2 TaxID=2908210 RepID=UPI001F383CA0|nr:M56 family metallopeptidase [Antarcticibacterium sp. 1MA-6-2]UJH89889.1 hypothetical protein LZ575_12905 [Antarcticibacterium sp. 1MA-6-2]